MADPRPQLCGNGGVLSPPALSALANLLPRPLPGPGQGLVTNSTSGHSGTQRGNAESISPDMPEPLEEHDRPATAWKLLPGHQFTLQFAFYFTPRSEVLEEQGARPVQGPKGPAA